MRGEGNLAAETRYQLEVLCSEQTAEVLFSLVLQTSGGQRLSQL